jgi:hypothetical protein
MRATNSLSRYFLRPALAPLCSAFETIFLFEVAKLLCYDRSSGEYAKGACYTQFEA